MDFVHVELKRDTWLKPEKTVSSPKEAVDVIKELIKDRDREMVACIHMTIRNRVISAEICSTGTMDVAAVSPAEVLRTALLAGAKNIIIMHNHPSGDCTPSVQDRDITKAIGVTAKILGIDLADHIIIGGNEYYSFLEREKELFSSFGTTTASIATEKKRGKKK